MYKSILLGLLFAVLYSCNSVLGNDINPESTSIQDGHNAYFQMDHKTAYSIYTNIWNDANQTVEVRNEAGQFIAKMDWLFYKNTAKALKTIDLVEKLHQEPARLFALKARILADQSMYAKAILASQKAIDLSKSMTESYHTNLAYCQHVFSKIKQDHWDIRDTTELENAYVTIRDLATVETGDVDVANLFLGYSLLLNRGEDAFKGWMSYYRLTSIDQVHPSLIKAMPQFKEAFLNYKHETMTRDSLLKVIKGLAESGFYEYAMLVKALHPELKPEEDAEINQIVHYYDFLQKIGGHTTDFYLRIIEGIDDKDDYRNNILKEANILWDQLVWEAKKPTFSKTLFEKELTKRFKAVVKMMSANGYFGLHMGHIILDDRKVITQYNESADFRYISIDHMVSNGYSAWFWDGQAQTGGWANDDESFLQVRSAYTSGPVRAWQQLTDSLAVSKIEKSIKELRVSDDSLALNNPHTFLPGLSARISYYQSKQLLDSLIAAGIEANELRLTFINLIERIEQGASIYAHEGRHAIDKKNNYSKRSNRLEYTAKLSEVYFSEKPMLSFDAIMSRNIGDDTSHGASNLKVIEGLVAWMEKNKASLSMLDAKRPLLPQIDKLTDAQLKKAIRSLDPLAN